MGSLSRALARSREDDGLRESLRIERADEVGALRCHRGVYYATILRVYQARMFRRDKDALKPVFFPQDVKPCLLIPQHDALPRRELESLGLEGERDDVAIVNGDK